MRLGNADLAESSDPPVRPRPQELTGEMREATKGRAGKRYKSPGTKVKADRHVRLLAIVKEYGNAHRN